MNKKALNKIFQRIRIFLYSFLDGIKLPLIGQVKLNEVLILFIFPFLFERKDLVKFPVYKKVLLSLIFLLVTQVITDALVIGSASEDFLRGWGVTLVSIGAFIFFFKTLRDENTIVFFIFFSIIRSILSPSDERIDTDMSYFKFYIAPILINIVLFASFFLYRRRAVRSTILLFAGFGLLCFALDSRSIGLLFIVSSLVLFIYNKGLRLSKGRIIAFSIIGIIIYQIFHVVYINAVLSNQLGGEHASKQISRLENPYNPFELLLKGRGETFGAISAIKDKPFFGHGSWAKDKTLKYTVAMMILHDDEGGLQRLDTETDKEWLIPSHSVILGAWTNYGIGGFLSVVALFYYLMKAGLFLINKATRASLYPIFIFITVQIGWTFLFSPFQHIRFTIPSLGAILISGYYYYKSSYQSGKDVNSFYVKEKRPKKILVQA